MIHCCNRNLWREDHLNLSWQIAEGIFVELWLHEMNRNVFQVHDVKFLHWKVDSKCPCHRPLELMDLFVVQGNILWQMRFELWHHSFRFPLLLLKLKVNLQKCIKFEKPEPTEKFLVRWPRLNFPILWIKSLENCSRAEDVDSGKCNSVSLSIIEGRSDIFYVLNMVPTLKIRRL